MSPQSSPPSQAIKSKAVSGFWRFLSSRRFAFFLAATALFSGITTFGLLTGTSPGDSASNTQKVTIFLIIDLAVLLMLVAIIAHRTVAMWVQRRQGAAGSALHVRMVVMFSLIAITPAILVAVFSALFLNFGINAWFDQRVRTAVDASQVVATAYLEEHVKNIGTSVLGMANTLNINAAKLASDGALFAQTLTDLAHEHGLSDAVVVNSSARIISSGRFSLLSLRPGEIPADAFERADKGEVVVLTAPDTEQVRAVVKLNRYNGAYLLVERYIDVRVLSNMERVREASKSYLSLEQSRGTIQITFVAIFAVVALLLLLASVWIGMTMANQLVGPIARLINAAQKIADGDLNARVDTSGSIGELSSLSIAFNTMADQVNVQQDGLLNVNRELDERRRFTETVLSGVSAGVIGLNRLGNIDIANPSASSLLGLDLSLSIGVHLDQIVPAMAELLILSMDRPDRVAQAEITIQRDQLPRQLMASITAEQLNNDIIGYVVTFDDITELQSAQRNAAWSDVARRIAHEIKNPLTPIQLSAERLKRKYLKQIKDDPETFVMCTDTIVRQVEDLGRMVDEFSSFSRMPQAVLRRENLTNLCRQALFSERSRDLEVNLQEHFPSDPVHMECDGQQISQALTNVLKNAIESVTENEPVPGSGLVDFTLNMNQDGIIITIEDNGKGLPTNDLTRLTEPYVTTRDNGTGLGLAIVKKIMEDHGGTLTLQNRPQGGARVILSFPDAQSNHAQSNPV